MPINHLSPAHGQTVLPQVSSHPSKAQSSGTQHIPLMDQNRYLAPLVNVSFAENCPEELKEIAPYVFRAFNPIAQPGFNKIHVKPIFEETEDDMTTEGTTEPHPAQRAVTIEIAHLADPDLSHDQNLARYALNLTHEVFLHGAYYFATFDRHEKGSQEPYKSEKEQHRSIVHPPNDQNPYLNVVRHVLQHLPDRNSLRVEFLTSYTNDVYSHLVEDIPEQAQEPVRVWLGRLEDIAGRPRDPMWAALATKQLHANLTQILYPV